MSIEYTTDCIMSAVICIRNGQTSGNSRNIENHIEGRGRRQFFHLAILTPSLNEKIKRIFAVNLPFSRENKIWRWRNFLFPTPEIR